MEAASPKIPLVKTEPGVRRRRLRVSVFLYPPAVAAFVIGALLSVIVAQQAQKWEKQRLNAQFQRLAEDRISILQNFVDFNLSVLHPVKSYYDSSEHIERREFTQFVGYLLERYPTIHAFEWVPRVGKHEIGMFAEAAAASGHPEFRITEAAGATADRIEYYPAYFVVPFEKNRSVFGFNHASDAEKAKAMQKSRDLRTLVSTHPMRLSRFAGDKDDPYGVVSFLPVYRKEEQIPSAEERRKHLIGFVASVFHVGEMLDAAQQRQTHSTMNLYFYADTPEEDNALVYAYGKTAAPGLMPKPDDGALEYGGSLDVGGHIWHVVCRSTPDFTRTRQRWESRLVLLAGLLLTLLFAYYLYSFERGKIQQAFAEMSITDELTGLYNRRGFLILAEQQRKLALRHRKGFHLLYADLDGLKKINDTYGHAEGDDAIREAAAVLREAFRESDLVARIGGDEYAVLAFDTGQQMNGVLHAHLERKIAERRVDRPHGYQFSLSIGSAYFDPENPASVEDLMKEADRNLYEKKRSHR